MAKSTQEEKLIKAVNERVKDVARLLGKDSKLYNDYRARIEKAFDSSEYKFSGKDGTIQISHGKKVQQKEDLTDLIDFIKRLPTAGEIKRRAKESIKEDKKGRPTKSEIDERARELDLINDFFENEKDNIYALANFSEIEEVLKDKTRGRRLTYAELNELIKKYNKIKKQEKLVPKDLFKGL